MKTSIRVIKLILWVWVFTVVFGTVYATGQHILRGSADDAQVELAEETVSELNLGKSPGSVIPTGSAVELRDSLRSYVIIYDDNHQQIAGNARLDGTAVDVPEGVLEHARSADDHRITWEPASGIRSDIVVKHFSNPAQSGFVVAGKSLWEVEKHEDTVQLLSLIGWLLTVIPICVYVWLANQPAKAAKPGKTSRKK